MLRGHAHSGSCECRGLTWKRVPPLMPRCPALDVPGILMNGREQDRALMSQHVGIFCSLRDPQGRSRDSNPGLSDSTSQSMYALHLGFSVVVAPGFP